MEVIRSPFNDPALNCALEKYLITDRSGDFLLLYINDQSVIVGRNQSVEAETDTAYCASHGIDIVRRPSGGGAVFHDRGNINYSLISDRNSVSILDGDPARPVIDALAFFGVTASAGTRRELLVGGRKISGTASYSTSGRQMFHGTLLHRSDLHQMSLALNGDPSKRGKRVASVPSTVMNLSEIQALDVPTDIFMKRLADFFLGYYGKSAVMELTDREIAAVARRAGNDAGKK